MVSVIITAVVVSEHAGIDTGYNEHVAAARDAAASATILGKASVWRTTYVAATVTHRVTCMGKFPQTVSIL